MVCSGSSIAFLVLTFQGRCGAAGSVVEYTDPRTLVTYPGFPYAEWSEEYQLHATVCYWSGGGGWRQVMEYTMKLMRDNSPGRQPWDLLNHSPMRCSPTVHIVTAIGNNLKWWKYIVKRLHVKVSTFIYIYIYGHTNICLESII